MQRALVTAVLVLLGTLAPSALLAQVSDNMVAIHGNVAPEAQKLTALGAVATGKVLTLEIQFTPRNQDEVNRLLADQQDSSSPLYHKWITPKEYTKRFGPTEADYASVSKWITSNGFQITGGSRAESKIRFTGSVDQAQKAFATRIMNFKDNDHFANITEAKVPVQFQPIVGEVTGLQNLGKLEPVLRPNRIQMRKLQAPRKFSTTGLQPAYNLGILGGTGDTFAPADLYTFYDENPLLAHSINGSPQNDCIGIFGDTNVFADILADWTSGQFTGFSLPPIIGGSDTSAESNPGVVAGFDTEAYLDIEWSHATAPGDPIVLYVGNPLGSFTFEQNLQDAIGAAVHQNRCGAINISYMDCNQPPSFYTSTMGSIFTQAALQGQSVFVSAGDRGVDTCELGSPNVNELSANPLVTSVGGTQTTPNFDQNGNDVGFTTESAWNQETPSTLGQNTVTGGGASQVFSKPSYQAGSGVPNDGARDVPDVAMLAGAPFVLIALNTDSGNAGVDELAFTIVGGTSLAAPLWSGISRLIQQVNGARPGPLNPGIYYLANNGYASNGFRDVLNGNNTYTDADGQTVQGFSAGQGYDLTTGWGTVDIADFVNAYSTTLAPVTGKLQITPAAGNFGAVKVGKTKTIKFHVRNAATKKSKVSVILLNASISNFPIFAFNNKQSTCLIEQTLAPGKSCIFAMAFSPTVTGPQTDALTIGDNANNEPQVIKFKGSGK